jgi:hypothetical protein
MPCLRQASKPLWASLKRHTTTDGNKQESHRLFILTLLDSHLQLTTIFYFQKMETSNHFKKRGDIEKPYE